MLLILLHGFFVASEFGIVAVDRGRVEQLAQGGGRRSRALLATLKTLSYQLSGAQLGITITSLLVGFMIEPVIAPVLSPALDAIPFLPNDSVFGTSVAVALLLATAVEMVIAELIPKNLAIARPEPVALALAPALRIANRLMGPVIVFLNGSANWAVRRLGIEPRDELHSLTSLEELEIMIRSSREGGAIDEPEYVLLSRTISFGDKSAQDALTPRTALVTLAADETVADLQEKARQTGHSRFPVTGRDIDDVVGIAHVKDTYTLPRRGRGTKKVDDIAREPLVIPETRDLGSLLGQMRRERHQMAIVVDEYGGTAGVITLEDILEEIVGDIEDEYDLEIDAQTVPPPGIHVLDGTTHAGEVEELTGFTMPEGDYETLAGFLLHLFGRIPTQGEHASYDGWELKVVEMDRRRIARILVVSPASEQTVEEPA